MIIGYARERIAGYKLPKSSISSRLCHAIHRARSCGGKLREPLLEGTHARVN
jgi:hypothetical protein